MLDPVRRIAVGRERARELNVLVGHGVALGDAPAPERVAGGGGLSGRRDRSPVAKLPGVRQRRGAVGNRARVSVAQRVHVAVIADLDDRRTVAGDHFLADSLRRETGHLESNRARLGIGRAGKGLGFGRVERVPVALDVLEVMLDRIGGVRVRRPCGDVGAIARGVLGDSHVRGRILEIRARPTRERVSDLRRIRKHDVIVEVGVGNGVARPLLQRAANQIVRDGVRARHHGTGVVDGVEGVLGIDGLVVIRLVEHRVERAARDEVLHILAVHGKGAAVNGAERAARNRQLHFGEVFRRILLRVAFVKRREARDRTARNDHFDRQARRVLRDCDACSVRRASASVWVHDRRHDRADDLRFARNVQGAGTHFHTRCTLDQASAHNQLSKLRVIDSRVGRAPRYGTAVDGYRRTVLAAVAGNGSELVAFRHLDGSAVDRKRVANALGRRQ